MCAVGGDGGHGLDRVLHALDDLSAGAGDDPLDLLAAVCQRLGGGLGGDLGPVHEGRLGRGDRRNYVTDGFDAALDRFRAIGGAFRDRFYGLGHTVDDLLRGLRDNLFLLGGAVRHGFGDGLGHGGYAVHNLCSGVCDGSDHSLGCVLHPGGALAQTLSQAFAGVHADLVKNFGGGVDAQNPLDDVGQLLGQTTDFLHQGCPAAGQALPQALYDL